MPTPRPNDQGPQPDRPSQPPADRCGIEELLTEAETLRTLLQDASARAGRLLAALKHQWRQGQAVHQALQSLRRLGHLGG